MRVNEMTCRGKVSVCMATYNGEKYVKAQVESVLTQLLASDELIVSDDGSTDDTLTIIKSINDPRVRVFESLSEGVVLNFENALRQVSGDVVVLCDQDDIWLPDRLDMALEGLKLHDLAVVGFQVVDADLNPVNNTTPAVSLSFIKTLARNGYLGCCMAFRASILPHVLPFPKGVAMHDWWIALLCLLKFKVFICSREGILYRRHASNASSTGSGSQLALGRRILIRFHLLLVLTKRFLDLG